MKIKNEKRSVNKPYGQPSRWMQTKTNFRYLPKSSIFLFKLLKYEFVTAQTFGSYSLKVAKNLRSASSAAIIFRLW